MGHVFLLVGGDHGKLTHILSQKEIMEMECDLLISNFKNPKTIALVKENIERISEGSSSHCVGALGLVLEKAFKFKKPIEGAKLRCSYSRCPWYNDHLSYSSIGLKVVYCQMCNNDGRGSYCLQCADCGYDRTGEFTECQQCKKTFL